MMRRLSIALVSKYPQPWRDRYGDEVLELLRESPARLSDVSELFRGLIVERARALMGDSDHPKRTGWILASIQPMFTVLIVLSAIGVGAILQSRKPPVSDIAELTAWGAASLIFLYIAFFIRRRWRLGWQNPHLPICSAATGFASLPIVFAAIVILEWTQWGGAFRVDEPQWATVVRVCNRLWIYGHAVSNLSSALWPGRQMLTTLGQLEALEEHVKSAEKWVAGCHEVEALGLTSPRDEAERLLAQRICERDEVREQLNALGYRARFERS
jgi:hypothetical protein